MHAPLRRQRAMSTSCTRISLSEGEQSAYVVVVTFSNLERLNAVNPAMLLDASRAIREASDDPEVLAVVIRGDPACRMTSSGADLAAGASAEENDRCVLAFMRAVMQCKALVVVAVHGPAIGIMSTVLLHADLVVAASTAFFWMPFAQLGIVPEFGASALLPRLVGRQLSTRVLLWGDRLSSHRAKDLGLVTDVVEEDGADATPGALVLQRAMQHLQRLVATVPRPTETARLYKEMMQSSLPLPSLVDWEMQRLRARVDEGVGAEGAMLKFSRRGSKL
jgi:enoyl-CoA hydratase/carnithine racemase